MPWDAVICRRKLDESIGLGWICECPFCREERKRRVDEKVFLGNGAGQGIRSESENDLPEAVG